jgi:outer membrane protein OmpA-like peptidoglycan-associated protein
MNDRDNDAIRDLVHCAYGEPVAPRFDVDAGFVDLMRRVESAEPAAIDSTVRPRVLSGWLTIVSRVTPPRLAAVGEAPMVWRSAMVAVVALMAGALAVAMSASVQPLAREAAPPPGQAAAVSGPPAACGNTSLPAMARIAFPPNQATFQDPTAAQATLQRLAGQAAGQNFHVELIVMAFSWGTEEGPLTLSRQRAEAVRQVLIHLGMPSDRVSIMAVGTNSAGYITARDPDGNLLPELAAQDRSVIVRLSCWS